MAEKGTMWKWLLVQKFKRKSESWEARLRSMLKSPMTTAERKEWLESLEVGLEEGKVIKLRRTIFYSEKKRPAALSKNA